MQGRPHASAARGDRARGRQLAALLKPGGLLLLNWRITRPADIRDERGRLYSAFESGLVREALAGHALLVDEEDQRSGMAYHTMLARIGGAAAP